MNILEHYIVKIHSEKNITDEFTRQTGKPPHEPIFLIDMDTDCYGCKERIQKHFFESEWNQAKQTGYYLA